MNKLKYIACLALAAFFAACQPNMDVNVADPALEAPAEASITGDFDGNDYVWTWTLPADTNVVMQVTSYANGNKTGAQTMDKGVVSFRHVLVETNVAYTYVFKYTDGKNYSLGTIKSLLRAGAGKCANLAMEQVELDNGYDARISWDKNETATALYLTIKETSANTEETKNLAGDVTEYLIKDVKKGEKYEVVLVAENAEGKSLPVATSLPIGSTRVAFLSEWATPEEHIANADDDEACAWIWFHEAYPKGTFMPFADIKNADILEEYRVLFWLRDLETGNHLDCFNYSAQVEAATPFIEQWYMDGGSLLLWQHACTYIEKLGRIPEGSWLGNDNAIGTGVGGVNNDTWRMALQLAPGEGKFIKDHSTHPLYRGLADKIAVEGNQKLLPVKGAGWTEDHNCLFFNYPSALTGLGNQDEACYNALTNIYGIYPLGTWDSQINWVSQLNVWEARQGNTPYLGTILCLGNGGLEFSLKNEDGTPDLTMKNNSCQETINTIAKNAIEYLKTR